MKVSTIQLKMARAALGWTIRELAERARIHVNTAQRIEAGLPAQSATLQTVQRVYEDAGLEFIFADSGGGPGVRLKLNAEIPAPGGRSDEGEDNEPDGLKALDCELVDHWRKRPRLWHSLSETGQRVLSREMFGEDCANEVRPGE
ncbi:helix-turn-helix domain protein [Rhodomicrobium vannielii ATCC 17100]|uniref:Helix-turn-helix domain protein n=1 Tax=Rhodomicrobium vannielii (strain ATCC 17100 / DSM 162 / LMG 4299 / NCIMB 10020 / ATH 3.1.1) TaxID=648757 RepID=E3I8M4_RHOVT|nr:helix-turn-helix transcriptional regulator [Rhodomicrobium vannielii]ADP72003.1 helix-turn-helix domain protein [Rhodomicrobium vannielii ATCC 17100]